MDLKSRIIFIGSNSDVFQDLFILNIMNKIILLAILLVLFIISIESTKIRHHKGDKKHAKPHNSTKKAVAHGILHHKEQGAHKGRTHYNTEQQDQQELGDVANTHELSKKTDQHAKKGKPHHKTDKKHKITHKTESSHELEQEEHQEVQQAHSGKAHKKPVNKEQHNKAQKKHNKPSPQHKNLKTRSHKSKQTNNKKHSKASKHTSTATSD